MKTNYSITVTVSCLAILVIAGSGIEAKALKDSVKASAKKVAEKTAAVADKIPETEKTGGLRQTALHTGVDIALEKGVQALGTVYPPAKIAGPIAMKLAKPLINSVHGSINNLFKKDKQEGEVQKEVASEEAKKEEPEKAEEKNVEASGDQQPNANEEKKGVISKVKDLFTKDEDSDQKHTAESNDEAAKSEEESKNTENSKAAEKPVESDDKKEAPHEEKEGVMSKLKKLVKKDGKSEKAGETEAKNEEPKEEVKEESKPEVKEEPKKEEKKGVLSKMKSLITHDKDDSKTEDTKSEKKE